MKLFLVEEGYPCEDTVDILGVFSSKEEAEKHFKIDNRFIRIHEIELNKVTNISI